MQFSDIEQEAMLRNLKELFAVYCEQTQKVSKELAGQILGTEEVGKLVDQICMNLPLDYVNRQKLLEAVGGFELLKLLLIIFNLGPGIVLAEFLADDFKLLAQNIITLVLIDPLFDFSLNLRTDLLNLNLVGDHDAERIIPLGKLHSLQQFLAVYLVEGQIHAPPKR